MALRRGTLRRHTARNTAHEDAGHEHPIQLDEPVDVEFDRIPTVGERFIFNKPNKKVIVSSHVKTTFTTTYPYTFIDFSTSNSTYRLTFQET